MIVTFRWYLMHWLVFHLLALVLLFITSILVFVVQVSLWKLIGIIPVVVAIFTIYCWAKVTLVMYTAGVSDLDCDRFVIAVFQILIN